MLLEAFFVSIMLMGSNIVYQLFKEIPDWGLAAERSYFQVVAVFIFVIIHKLINK